MDSILSFLISTGIIVVGGLIVVCTVIAGSPLAWTVMGLLPVIVGSLSLYDAIQEAKAKEVEPHQHARRPF
jgi:hypothetical protein